MVNGRNFKKIKILGLNASVLQQCAYNYYKMNTGTFLKSLKRWKRKTKARNYPQSFRRVYNTYNSWIAYIARHRVVSVPCARLYKLAIIVILWAHVNISYRIASYRKTVDRILSKNRMHDCRRKIYLRGHVTTWALAWRRCVELIDDCQAKLCVLNRILAKWSRPTRALSCNDVVRIYCRALHLITVFIRFPARPSRHPTVSTETIKHETGSVLNVNWC